VRQELRASVRKITLDVSNRVHDNDILLIKPLTDSKKIKITTLSVEYNLTVVKLVYTGGEFKVFITAHKLARRLSLKSALNV
jgi:hypothetical protein